MVQSIYLGGNMQVGDLVKHIRQDKVIGIVIAIHLFPHDAGWADVLWADENRAFKERMRNLRVVSCE
jgi:hypothetical protein